MRPWPLTPSQYGSSQDVYIKLKDYLLFSYSLNAHGCEKALKWHCIEVVYSTVEDLDHGKCCSAVLNGNVQKSSDQTSVCCQTQSIPRLMLNMSIEGEERDVPLWYFLCYNCNHSHPPRTWLYWALHSEEEWHSQYISFSTDLLLPRMALLGFKGTVRKASQPSNETGMLDMTS